MLILNISHPSADNSENLRKKNQKMIKEKKQLKYVMCSRVAEVTVSQLLVVEAWSLESAPQRCAKSDLVLYSG